ncbi:MAG: DsbA family oxidoreductase [Thermoplasmata archaeon]
MRVEVWMDVVCPWCYIGRRRFESALAHFDGRDSVEVVFRSFELDPEAPREDPRPVTEYLAAKYGMSLDAARQANERVARIAAVECLEFHLDTTRPCNTLDAHRILQLAGIRRVRAVVEERFQKGYFTEGASLADPETLLRLATEAGLAEYDVRRVLAGQAFTLQVRADEKEAAERGCTGVPFFVFDGARQVSGAQPTELFQRALHASSTAQ